MKVTAPCGFGEDAVSMERDHVGALLEVLESLIKRERRRRRCDRKRMLKVRSGCLSHKALVSG